MFILRTIEETRENENAQWTSHVTNLELGDCYTLFYRDSKEFAPLLESHGENVGDIRIILISEAQRQGIFLMGNTETVRHNYFIMTDTGKTFERL